MSRVLDARSVRLYFDHLFLLSENTAKDKYYWHQDLPYWACRGNQICSLWLALTDCSPESGALEFVLDTDKGALYAPIAFGKEAVEPAQAGDGVSLDPIPSYHEQLAQYRFRTWEISAGDALLFNSRIMHSSRGNHSKTKRRVAYSTRWIGEEMVYWRHPWYQDPVTLIEPAPPQGARLVSDKFPIVWPRQTYSRT